MRFSVPKFIEEKPKIIAFFTFGQFAIVGGAVLVCIFLYFLVPFFLFLISTIILVGGAFAISFLKIRGYSLPSLFANLLNFSFSPKIYIWKKKILLPKIIEKEIAKPKEEKPPELKIAAKSRLRDLFTQVEIRSKYEE